MIIKEVRVIVTCPGRNFVLVKILTDEGIYGIGDATLNGRELAVAKSLQEYIGPLLIGKDPDRIEDVWQELFRGSYWRDGPVLMTALSGVDMALWDIKGKACGLPVYSLLGGKTREKVRVYMHCSGESMEETLKSCRDAMKKGCTALRVTTGIPGFPNTEVSAKKLDELIKGGKKAEILWEPEPYLKIIPSLFCYLREELGNEVDLIHDIHGRLSPIQACQLAKDIERYKPFFVEDPVRPEYIEALKILRSNTVVPIAVGELFFDKWSCATLVSKNFVDFLRVDITHVGGITEAKKLAVISELYGVDMAFHGPTDISPIAHVANVHIDFSIPNFGIQEWIFHNSVVNRIIKTELNYEHGYLTLTDKPGLGVDIDEEMAKKYPYRKSYLPTSRRIDGSVTDW
ncbi:MAG: D-galactonate dehydratase family protein [Promethearchaeota archaeon]